MQAGRSNSCRYSGTPLNEPIVALIVDGIWGKFRQLGRGVILVAFGVTPCGSIRLLDWSASKSENIQSWMQLLQRLMDRGLANVSLVVGDGSLGLPKAAELVYPNSSFQICLWHLCPATAGCAKLKELIGFSATNCIINSGKPSMPIPSKSVINDIASFCGSGAESVQLSQEYLHFMRIIFLSGGS